METRSHWEEEEMTLQRRTFRSAVVSVEERKDKHHVQGVGDQAIFEEHSLGWWVRVAGSSSLFMGDERPNLRVGDTVTLALEWEE